MKKLLAILLSLATLLCLCACDNSSSDYDDDDDDRTDSPSAKQAGYYRFVEMTYADGEVWDAQYIIDHDDDDDLDDYYLHLFSDGTGIACIYGDPLKVKWDEDGIWPVDDPTEILPYTYRFGTLTWGKDGQEIIFEKVCEEFVLNSTTEDMVGDYYLYEQTVDGTTYDRDFMKTNNHDYREYYVKLYDNGTGMVQDYTALLWNENYLWYDSDKDCSDACQLEVDGDYLTLTSGNDSYTYLRE